MCQGEQSEEKGILSYSWDEIRKHASKKDRWIVIDNKVYDVTSWGKRHPGGERLITNHAGEDATDAWVAFHPDREKVGKYLRPLLLGVVREEEIKTSELIRDFRDLRQTVEEMGLFKTDPWFFTWTVGHLLVLEGVAWLVFFYLGNSWLPYLLASLLLATAQTQAGWSQHDFGHLSVCESSRWNHAIQLFIINFFKRSDTDTVYQTTEGKVLHERSDTDTVYQTTEGKVLHEGASAHWWNYRHFQHHAKPNVIQKDPDMRLEYIHMVGNKIPVEWGKTKKGLMPYNHQHNYFYFIMPPLLMPLYFNYEIPYYLITRKQWVELFWMMTFHLRWQIIFSPFLGPLSILGLYMFVRFLESHWFVWTTQMNHLPMEVDHDKHLDWVRTQLQATCNVDQSAFNDWFTGHLNFQIEHHFFPTMPRHNYHKVAPLCRSLCEKHGLQYKSKPLLTAFADIVSSLKVSGKLWYEAYNM